MSRPLFQRSWPMLLLLALLLFVTVGVPGDGHAVTRQEAIDYVIDNIIPTLEEEPILRAYALQDSTAPSVAIAQNGIEVLGSAPPFATWFIWLDLKPGALFRHPTKFILINASGSMVNSVTEFDGDLWPTIDGVTYYETHDDRVTSPDLFWEDGGIVPKPGASERGKPDLDRRRGQRLFEQFKARLGHRPWTAADDTWGMIVTTIDTATDAGVKADVECAIESFESLGVTNITYSLNKNKAATLACIDSLPNGCDKLYVFWVGHGGPNELVFSGEPSLSPKDLACKLKDQGADEYCLIMETCFSGSFLDEFAEKGLDGFHVTSTSDSAYTSIFRDAASGKSPFNGAPYGHYLWECLQGGLRGIDAHQWADSLVEALRDSLTNSADSLRWRANWGGEYDDDDDAQGQYVHTFDSAGVNGSGMGEPFRFEVQRGCSTVCIDFPGIAGSDTCGNFTLSCAVDGTTGSKWIKKATYNWNVGKTVYFHTYDLPNATGEYQITMHSNKGGVRVGITWLGDTSIPETEPNSFIFNAQAVGWIDGSGEEFNGSFVNPGQIASFSWNDGTPYFVIPRYFGPNYWAGLDFFLNLEPDFDRPFLYDGGDPSLGFVDNTLLILQAAAIRDPDDLQLDFPFAEYTVNAFQETGGNYGPFNGVIEDVGGGAKATPDATTPGISVQDIPPVIINLGRIIPEPLIVSISMPGPGVVVWDALLLSPEAAIITDVLVPGVPRSLVLAQNQPNPFNPRTTLRYELPRAGHVRLQIFDIRGRLVRTLVDAPQGAGPQRVLWDGRSDQGTLVSTGIYVYRLDAASETRSRKMALIR